MTPFLPSFDSLAPFQALSALPFLLEIIIRYTPLMIKGHFFLLISQRLRIPMSLMTIVLGR
jgi:hypothetical protein